MSSRAAVFSSFRPSTRRSTPRQSVEVYLWDASSRLTEVLQRLRELERLPANWDSYQSQAPQMKALQAARQFIAFAPWARLPAPSVSPVPGGGLGFHWKVRERDLEIEFSPDGSAEYVRTTGDEESSIVQGVLGSPEAQEAIWEWLLG